MDFVEKRSSYLEKASHSIEKKRFVVQKGGGQPLLWNFNGDYIYTYTYTCILYLYTYSICFPIISILLFHVSGSIVAIFHQASFTTMICMVKGFIHGAMVVAIRVNGRTTPWHPRGRCGGLMVGRILVGFCWGCRFRACFLLKCCRVLRCCTERCTSFTWETYSCSIYIYTFWYIFCICYDVVSCYSWFG